MIKANHGLALSHNAIDIASLAESYGPIKGIRSNHVINASGEFWGSDGSSRSISTSQDRELLLALRSAADLIVVDAATARLEQYRAPKSRASLAIFSISGDFTKIPAVQSSDVPIYLFAGSPLAKYSANPNAQVIGIKTDPFDDFLEWAMSLKYQSILLEAGPTLSAKAFEAGIVQQSALTRTGFLPDFEPMSLKNPFDESARLISLAQGVGASFELWSH